MENSQEDIVTLIPRFVITEGEPPVREIGPPEVTPVDAEVSPTLLPEDAEELWAPAPRDTPETLLPADIDNVHVNNRLPARSMLRRLPSLLD